MDQYRAFLACATLQASSSTDPNGWPMGRNGPQTKRSPQTLLDQGDTSLCDTIHSHYKRSTRLVTTLQEVH